MMPSSQLYLRRTSIQVLRASLQAHDTFNNTSQPGCAAGSYVSSGGTTTLDISFRLILAANYKSDEHGEPVCKIDGTCRRAKALSSRVSAGRSATQ